MVVLCGPLLQGIVVIKMSLSSKNSKSISCFTVPWNWTVLCVICNWICGSYSNQSNNRSIQSAALISQAKPGKVVWQPTWCSTAISKKQFHSINIPSGIIVSTGGKTKSERSVLNSFLKIKVEVVEGTDSGMLFQRQGAQDSPFTLSALGTNRVISLFDLNNLGGSGVAIMKWR